MENGKNKIIALSNGTMFELGEGELCCRVKSGTAYLFALEKTADGLEGARTDMAVYKEGDVIISIPPSGSVRFALAGSPGAQIEVLGAEIFAGAEGKRILERALRMAASPLRRGLPGQEDFSEILLAKNTETAVREYAKRLSADLRAIRAADLLDEQRSSFERQKKSEAAFESALENIAAAAGKTKGAEDPNALQENALVRAAALAAQYDKIPLKALEEKDYSGQDALAELAKDNNIRIRSVTLKEGWHLKDNGALFAWISNGKKAEEAALEPCALLPQKFGGYVCVVPSRETSFAVDEKNAALIQAQAAMFYKPFPDKRVSLKDALAFAFSARSMKGDAAFFVLLGISSTLVGLLIPELTRAFIDSIIPQAAKNTAVQISALALLCVLSAAAFDLVKALALARMETRSEFLLQAAVMDRLLKLPVDFFKSYTAGDLAQRTMAVSQIRSAAFDTLIASAMAFAFALVYLFQLFRYSPLLLKWGILFSLISIAVTVLLALCQYKWSKNAVKLSARISGTLYQFVSGVNKLVTTASEKQAFALWAKDFSAQNENNAKARSAGALYATFISVLPLLTTLLFYGIFMHGVAAKKMAALSTGSFLAFMASFMAFQNALIAMANALSQSVSVVPLYEQARTILDARPEVQEAKPAVARLSGAIELSRISFRYSKDLPLALNDVSIKIAPGEFVAIVGGSGSGKSTLMRILLGFEKAESGSVFFDNYDLSSIDAGSARRNMGVVLQNSEVMQGTIFSNISGGSALTMDDAWQAAEIAGLAEDIRAMPMGMHTVVGAGGGTLSGGQRQRLIIARAISRKPNILIFDEATSALDNRTQAQVIESLSRLKATRIVIAHRLSAIINADRIYALNHGVVEESGTYDELMKKGGFFAELARRQL